MNVLRVALAQTATQVDALPGRSSQQGAAARSHSKRAHRGAHIVRGDDGGLQVVTNMAAARFVDESPSPLSGLSTERDGHVGLLDIRVESELSPAHGCRRPTAWCCAEHPQASRDHESGREPDPAAHRRRRHARHHARRDRSDPSQAIRWFSTSATIRDSEAQVITHARQGSRTTCIEAAGGLGRVDRRQRRLGRGQESTEGARWCVAPGCSRHCAWSPRADAVLPRNTTPGPCRSPSMRRWPSLLTTSSRFPVGGSTRGHCSASPARSPEIPEPADRVRGRS